MRKNILILSVVLVIVLSSMMLFACDNHEEDMPLQQGSRVLAMAGNVPSGVEVTSFEKYGEFKKSEYADMHLPYSSVEVKKTFYDSKYFKNRDLVVAKFCESKSARFFIKNTAYKNGTYYVDLFKVYSSDLVEDKGAFALFLELPDSIDVKDSKVVLSFDEKPLIDNDSDLGDVEGVTSFQCESIRVGQGDVSARRFTSKSDLDEYTAKANDVTRKVVATFDDAFFEKNYLVELDMKKFDLDTMTSIVLNDNKILVSNFSSRHYEYHEPEASRQVRFIPVPKSRVLNEVIMVDYLEPNFGENIKPNEVKINF